jgi:hypothetical protein
MHVIIQPATIQSQSESWVILELPKCIVVLPRDIFVAGLKRGKAWRRAESFRARMAAAAVEPLACNSDPRPRVQRP